MLRKPHDRMFRKAQMKLFSLIVSILLAVFIALIGSINVITKEVMRGQSKEVLMQIASGIEYNDKNSTFTYTKPVEQKGEKRDKGGNPPAKPSETAKPATTEAPTTTTATTVTTKADETTQAVPSTDESTEYSEQFTPDEPEYYEEPHEEQPAETQPPETQPSEAQTTAPFSGQQSWAAWGQQDWNQQGQPDWNNWSQQDWDNFWKNWNNNNGGQQDWNNWNNWNNWGQQNGGSDPNNPWNPWDQTNPWNPWNQMNPWNPWMQWNGGMAGTPKMNSKEPDKNGIKVHEDNQTYKRYSSEEQQDEENAEAEDELIAEPQSFGGEAVLVNTVYTGEPVLEGFTVLSNSESSGAPTAMASPASEPSRMAYSKVEPIPKTLGSIDFFVIMADTKGNYLATLNNDKLDSQGAQDYITTILDNGKDTGMINGYQFYQTDKSNGTIMVLTDKSSEMDMLKQLKRTTIIIGLIALVVLSVFAYFLSLRSIQPIKVAFEKQKQFVSDASHELKTPLAVITTNADVLSEEIGENKWLEYIKAQTDRMNVLVNDLLNLTRLENNTTDFERKYFNLSKAVINTALPFECQAFENNKKFEVNVEDDIMLSGSEKHIKQMTAIFIDNALKYSNDGGTVRDNSPLTFTELMTYNTWYELHPEKVAGTMVGSSSFYFPVIVKGSKKDVENMFKAALKKDEVYKESETYFSADNEIYFTILAVGNGKILIQPSTTKKPSWVSVASVDKLVEKGWHRDDNGKISSDKSTKSPKYKIGDKFTDKGGSVFTITKIRSYDELNDYEKGIAKKRKAQFFYYLDDGHQTVACWDANIEELFEPIKDEDENDDELEMLELEAEALALELEMKKKTTTPTKTFRELVEENGDKILHWREATDPNKEYVTPFNYSVSHGGSIDSFKYYNDYVVEISN